MHLDGGLVDQLIQMRLAGGPLLVEVQEIKDLSSILITLEEVVAFVICADEDHAQVIALKTGVAVEHELFRASWDAHWSPRFALVHLRDRPDVIEE